ncbi:MAG: hypothetical protein DI585_04065 [Pseudomonas fluorescens]|nr:MAG: hypothetical protein DI585_04065 [Pseudomonas fluorescens]
MKKLALIATLATLSACSVNHGEYTVLSNKLVDTKNFHIDSSKVQKNVTGKDVSHIITFIPTKANPNINDALNDVFRNSDADVMTDVTITSWFWWIPYIYGQAGWKVEGDAVKTRSN